MREALREAHRQWYLLRLCNLSTIMREWAALHALERLARCWRPSRRSAPSRPPRWCCQRRARRRTPACAAACAPHPCVARLGGGASSTEAGRLRQGGTVACRRRFLLVALESAEAGLSCGKR